MEGLFEPAHQPEASVPLQLSRIVKDIQRKNLTLLNLRSTVYEAVVWMCDASVSSAPVITDDSQRRSITSLQTITAETLLKTLLDRMQDNNCTLGAFFSMPLSAFPCLRVPIVCPRMDLREIVHRMYRRRTDLLLAFDGVAFSGLVTAGDLFDAVIGSALINEAFFNKMDTTDASEILEGIRICCLKYKVAAIADRRMPHCLNPTNTILTAARTLCHRPDSGVLVSDHLRKIYRLITARDILQGLRNHFESSLSSHPLSTELMQPLEGLPDFSSPVLTPDNTVFEAVEAIHFNNLSGAVVLSERKHLEGIVTIQGLLKAFLDAINRTSSIMFE